MSDRDRAPYDPGDLPKHEEAALGDVYRAYKESEDARRYASVHEQHAKKELIARGIRMNASVFDVDGGQMEIVQTSDYQYNNAVVTGDFKALLMSNGLMDEFSEFVKVKYSLNRNWLNKLTKRGPEFVAIVEKVTTQSTGTPTIKGPSLQEMGGYVVGEST